MSIATEVLAVKVFNVSAGTPVPVSYPLYVPQEVFVYYGKDALLAAYNVDYTITLGAAPNFYTFTLVPTASLIAKINALIALDNTEVNFITIRRELPLLTASTPPNVANTTFTSREFDRVTMKLQQLKEQLNRSVVLPPTFVGVAPLTLYPGGADQLAVYDVDGNISPLASPLASELTALQGVEAGRALVYPASPAAPVYDAGNRRIGNVADAVNLQDAVTLAQFLREGIVVRDTRTAAKATDPSKVKVIYLNEGRRSGIFRWRLGDFTTAVAEDTLEGIYLKANTVAASVGAWVRDHHYGVVHVDWFGAVPDALYVGLGGGNGTAGLWYSDPAYTVRSTDSTQAIQAAVNTSPFGVARGGWVVQFDGGGYLISPAAYGTIATGVQRVVFRGEGVAGPHGSMIAVEGGNSDWFSSTYDSVSFYDLVFQGPSVGTGSAIVIGQAPVGVGQRAFSGRIMNCYFVGVGEACVKLINAEDYHVIACTMEICKYGVLALNADQIKIVNNTFYGCTLGGVYGVQGSDWNVVGNNFYVCANDVGAGVLQQGAIVWNAAGATLQSRDILISSNTFSQCNIDISLGGQTGNPGANTGPNFFSIIGNKSQYANAQSIYVNGPSNVMILDNSIVDANNKGYATTAAIEITGSTACTIDQNVNSTPAANKVDFGLKLGAGNTLIRVGHNNRFTGSAAFSAGQLGVSYSSLAQLDFPKFDRYPAAALQGGSVAYDGTILMDSTNNRLVYYMAGVRYYLPVGTTF